MVVRRRKGAGLVTGKSGRRRTQGSVDRANSERILWVAVTVVVLSPIVFWRGAMDVFSLPKATIVLVGAIFATGRLVRWWLQRGALTVPSWPFAVSLLLFLSTGLLAWVRSPLTWASLTGQYGRWSGFALYVGLAALSLATATAASFDRRAGRYLIRAMLVSGGLVAFYVLIQRLGLDPFDWKDLGLPSTFSSMGNVNFTSALLGITVPLALVEVADGEATRGWRWIGAGVFGVSLAGLAAADSLQGPLIAGVGLMIVLVGVAVLRSQRAAALFRNPAVVVLGLFVLLAGTAAAVATNWDRLLRVAGVGSEARLHFWETALRLAAERPILGWGFDTFGYWFTRYRPVEHAVQFGSTVTDEPHNLWLSMQVSGGLVLLVSYLAVIAIVASRIPAALRQAREDRRIEVVGLVAAWVAYHLQSLLSMDQPALAAIHWILAGVIVGLAAAPADRWERSISGLERKRRQQLGGAPVTVAMLLLSLVVAIPLAVDILGRSGLEAASAAPSAEQRIEGFDRLATAVRWAPWTGTYAFRRAEVLYQAGSPAGAYEAQVAAIERTPGQPRYVMNAANMAREIGDAEASARWWRRAARIDRNNPDVLRSAASFLEDLGDEEAARRILTRAQRLEAD